jgi:hypothetical protein
LTPQVCIFAQQRYRALRTDARRARQLVRRIAARRNEIGHLAWPEFVSLEDFSRADPRHLPCATGCRIVVEADAS